MNLILFDVDGTLTPPRLSIEGDMISCLKKIKKENTFLGKPFHIGFLGGSDYKKQIEQLGEEHLDLFDWKLTENGLITYFYNELVHRNSFSDFLGEDNFQDLMNIVLKIFSTVKIPALVKRGTFIEYRTGMINISPIGRQCSQKERNRFEGYDKIYNIREKIIIEIQKEWNRLYPEIELSFSIGGQISVDIFPKGWDKTYFLNELEKRYDTIYFFGDKTEKGGNDYEIYHDPRVKGISVSSPKDTIRILNTLFSKN